LREQSGGAYGENLAHLHLGNFGSSNATNEAGATGPQSTATPGREFGPEYGHRKKS